MSYGGGVQSTAMLVLAAQGKIDYQTALFCNVGHDSENPDTLAFVEKHAKPYAADHGIDLVELVTMRRDGTVDTIVQRLERQERTVHIPMRMSGNGAPGNRSCTFDFKIKQVAKWTKTQGSTTDSPAHVALGISIDEFQRMKTSTIPHQVSDYPLIDLRLSRQDCVRLITDAGLPVPPKSSCYFCPFAKADYWSSLRTKRPDLFGRAAELERMVNRKRAAMGRDEMWLSTALRPLDEAFRDDGQLPMFDDVTCDTAGYCHA
jgi:hypothetical protein